MNQLATIQPTNSTLTIPKVKPMPSIERLNALFEVDEFGQPIRRIPIAGQRKGEVAGWIAHCGYRYVGLDRTTYLWHRLHMHMNGFVLDGMQVDHLNGNRSDNRLSNLRLVTNGENQQNLSGTGRGKTSGLLGVTWQINRHRWMAQIKIGKKNTYLGYFDTPEEAHTAYLKAKAIHHPAAVMMRFETAA